MSDDLDALLARADQFYETVGIVLVGDLSAAIRTLRAERDAIPLDYCVQRAINEGAFVPVDDEALAVDIDAQIHIHCGDDGTNDGHNDWVEDLTGQIANLLPSPVYRLASETET